MIYIENKRRKVERIQAQYPNADILDITSASSARYAQMLSPFYPHGGIPIPLESNGLTATCVEAIWLQNMTYTQDKKQGTSPYTLRLCQLVAGKAVDPLWNNDWLKVEFTTNIPYDT